MTNEVMDALCAEVVGALTDAGVDCLVLKGPSIAQWLYTDGTPRSYHDIDVLVDPRRTHEAAQVLFDIGFVPPAPAYTDDTAVHAHAWHRYEDGAWLDLHYTLWGVGVAPQELWNALWPGREKLVVGGMQVAVLAKPARALHLALHVAQDQLGRGKKMEDLRRSIELLTPATWQEVTAFAGDVHAEAAMGVGLRQLSEGEALAEQLCLPQGRHVDLEVRGQGVAGGAAFSYFTQRPGLLGKFRYGLAKTFPPPWFLRTWSPVASRYGPLGLMLGYLHRLTWVARTTPHAARAWLRARRATGRGHTNDNG